MYFEWDEAKNRANVHKHGIDFQDVREMFRHPMLTLCDRRTDYGEDRWVGIGWMKLQVGVVVYTEQTGDIIRIISARKATREEVKQYVERIEN